MNPPDGFRAWRLDDADVYHRLRDRVTLELTGERPGLGGAERAIERSMDDPSRHHWAILDADGSIAGSLLLVNGQEFEVSFWLAPEARSRGIAGRAVRTATAWVFDTTGARGVVALVHPENHDAVRTLVSSGYRSAGLERVVDARVDEPGMVQRLVRRPMRALVVDLGGVVLESPFPVIGSVEHEAGLRSGTVSRVIGGSGDDGAWARHERGELSRVEFVEAFGGELAAVGAEVDVAGLLESIESALVPRTQVVEFLRDLRRRGVALGAVTNNWHGMDLGGLASEFDVLVESAVEGCRKPDTEIYTRCLARLGVEPDEAIMVDDIGENLRPARALGMATVLCDDPVGTFLRVAELIGRRADEALSAME